jgi:hypothetical protein
MEWQQVLKVHRSSIEGWLPLPDVFTLARVNRSLFYEFKLGVRLHVRLYGHFLETHYRDNNREDLRRVADHFNLLSMDFMNPMGCVELTRFMLSVVNISNKRRECLRNFLKSGGNDQNIKVACPLWTT